MTKMLRFNNQFYESQVATVLIIIHVLYKTKKTVSISANRGWGLANSHLYSQESAEWTSFEIT